MKFVLISITALLITLKLHAQEHKDSVISIYFATGDAKISPQGISTIDSLKESGFLDGNEGYTVTGYADAIGNESYNYELSADRSKNVVAYLKQLGVTDIDTVVAKGEIDKPERTGGYAEDRRVDISYGRKPKPSMSIDINKVSIDESFDLTGIYFHPMVATIELRSRPTLTNLSNLMQYFPKLKIQIEGHIHCDYKILKETRPDLPEKQTLRECGNKLSYDRAKAVYNYLAKEGIDTNRMKYVGMGCLGIQEHPHNNKRVAIRILEK